VTLVSGAWPDILRSKTGSRGDVKWASRIAGEVGGGYSHRQGSLSRTLSWVPSVSQLNWGCIATLQRQVKS